MNGTGLGGGKWILFIKWLHKPQVGQANSLLPCEAVKSCCKKLEVWAGSGLETAGTGFPPLGESLSFRAGRNSVLGWQAAKTAFQGDAPHDRGEEKLERAEADPKRGWGRIHTCQVVEALRALKEACPTVLLKLFCLWNRKRKLERNPNCTPNCLIENSVPDRLQVLSSPGLLVSQAGCMLHRWRKQDKLWGGTCNNKRLGGSRNRLRVSEGPTYSSGLRILIWSNVFQLRCIVLFLILSLWIGKLKNITRVQSVKSWQDNSEAQPRRRRSMLQKWSDIWGQKEYLC